MFPSLLASLRGYRWLVLPLLVLFGLLTSILLVEIAARALNMLGLLPSLHLPIQPLTTPDAYLRYRGLPQIHTTVTQPEFTIRVEHNSLGFQDSEWMPEPGPCVRIFALGDSFTWGWGGGQRRPSAYRLEGLLSVDKTCVEVLNFGVMGYGTSQEYMLWEEEGRRYRPDLVVVAFLFSDLAQSLNHMSRVPGIAELVREGRNLRLTGEAQVSLTPVDYLKGWLRQNSYIYFLATFVVKSNPTLRELLLGSAAANLIRPPHTAVIEAMEAGGGTWPRSG